MKFKEYLEKLESLDISKTLLKEDKIVFVISGSSNFKTAALEPDRFEILNTFGFLNMSDGKVDPAFTPQADQHVARVMENWFYCKI